ncbi:AAA family ATPase [Ramlibacter rhizophilus]|uniref:AAA family ATPase n=1 Tax=Ramlibacter rhizophilus TaxID=1781167 RepID=A0A4Z0BCC4_9BURK|nr:AAA family ATPase [Ramlibacter rhizophilus]TFY96882.1 AAA family ATPase [Ramlibacter rhizophilus]
MRQRCTYIVIIGPDGCGKTTVAQQLCQELSALVPVRSYCFSFENLPAPSTLLGRRTTVLRAGLTDSRMSMPFPTWKATLAAIWWGLDHVLGHAKLWPRDRRECVIFARSYHDFLYARTHINAPRPVVRFFLKLGPKADLIVVPHRSPASIRADKPELTPMEIGAQYARILAELGAADNLLNADADAAGVRGVVSEIRTRMPI